MTDEAPACPASGQPLPESARADYEADPSCTHFYCPECGKLLHLPTSPSGTIRRHKQPAAGAAPWPYRADGDNNDNNGS